MIVAHPTKCAALEFQDHDSLIGTLSSMRIEAFKMINPEYYSLFY